MKRITVEDVLSAYRATGLKPIRGIASGSAPASCAIGALSQHARGTRQGVYDWAEETYGKKYVNDFVLGFDDSTPRRSAGFRDGRAAAAAVFAESPAGEPR